MRKLLILLQLFYCYTNVNSQTIVNILEQGDSNTAGIYHKDVNNILNLFQGTWIYQEGGGELKIVLQKKIQYPQESGNWIDLLVGEYLYTQNNTVLVSTLPLDINIPAYNHNIVGNIIYYWNPNLTCLECDEVRATVRVRFSDPDRPYLHSRCLISYLDSNPNKILFKLRTDTSALPTATSPNRFRVPSGEYILTKVP